MKRWASASGVKQSFILTMWYVNGKLPRLPGTKTPSFILTMWYVNVEEEAKTQEDKVVLY